MLGWLREEAARASSRKRSNACGSRETSSGRNLTLRIDAVRCLRPCKRHPSRHRQAFQACGSGKSSGRSSARILRPIVDLVNESRGDVVDVVRRFRFRQEITPHKERQNPSVPRGEMFENRPSRRRAWPTIRRKSPKRGSITRKSRRRSRSPCRRPPGCAMFQVPHDALNIGVCHPKLNGWHIDSPAAQRVAKVARNL